MTLTVELLGSIAGAGAALFGIFWGFWRWLSNKFDATQAEIQRVRSEAIAKIARVNERATLADAAIRAELSAHNLYAAEHFATESKLTVAVKRVDDAVTRITERLDRYFEHRPPATGV